MSRKNTPRAADTAFYVPPRAISENALVLEGENFHHAIHVLRQDEGSTLFVVDGLGNTYSAVLERIDKRQAICAIVKKERLEQALENEIRLAVGLTKSRDRFEVLVEKAVELGVKEIVPLQSQRVQSRAFRAERLSRIAIAAMKQSGRATLTAISEPQTVSNFAMSWPDSVRVVLSMERGIPSLIDVLLGGQRATSYGIVAGPEGGLTDEEEDELVANGFQRVSLGRARLRTETAAIAAVAIISQFERRGKVSVSEGSEV